MNWGILFVLEFVSRCAFFHSAGSLTKDFFSVKPERMHLHPCLKRPSFPIEPLLKSLKDPNHAQQDNHHDSSE